MKLVDREYCLSPPPGCPKALYEFMIQCWWVFIATNPTAAINNILSIVDNLRYISHIKTAKTLSYFTNRSIWPVSFEVVLLKPTK